LEWLVVDDYSSWWLIAPIIHPKFKEATRFIDRILSLIEKLKITEFRLESYFDKTDIIKQICDLKGISFTISKNDYLLFQRKQTLKQFFKKYGYRKITKQKWKNRLNLFKKKYSFNIIPSNYALITSPGLYRREAWDPNIQKTKNEEFFIKPIIDELNSKNMPTLLIDLDYTFRGTTKILNERLDDKLPCIPIEFLLTSSRSNNINSKLNLLKNSINEMKNQNVEAVFEYKNISVWNYVKSIFDDIFLEPHLPTYLHLIESAYEFFKKSKPNVIIQVYEVGPYAKSLEIAAQKLQIRTIGVQHGLIPTDTPDYIFKELRKPDFLLGNIIPDLTFVFGDYYKKILVEHSAYPDDSIESIGHPSFFNIHKIKKILSRDQILNKYHLNDKKIILLPFSFRFTYITNSPDRILLDELYKGLKDSEDTIVLVRPHPGDKFNQDVLQQICPSKNFICSNASLFEDLTLCDLVVIAPISTVSSEAAIFEKPIFFVNVLDDDILESINPVYHELILNDVVKLIPKKDLIQSISSIKKGELWNTSSSSKRAQFLTSFFNLERKPNLFQLIYPD
jgi:hypothetical protein